MDDKKEITTFDGIIVEEVEFDANLAQINLEENDWSSKETDGIGKVEGEE